MKLRIIIGVGLLMGCMALQAKVYSVRNKTSFPVTAKLRLGFPCEEESFLQPGELYTAELGGCVVYQIVVHGPHGPVTFPENASEGFFKSMKTIAIDIVADANPKGLTVQIRK